jgi:Putative enzyme of poly-gamma-glutamate biosynthesis (capsule formation)
MLNYTYGLNGMMLPDDKDYMIDLMTDETKDKVISDIKRAREMSDAVIIFPHWGTEYSLTPDESQREWAQLFADEGVTLVVGAHPHVIEPIEWITGRNGNKMLCYYSVGNFISGQTEAETMVGLMAKVKLHKDSDGKVTIEKYDYEPLVTHRSAEKAGYTTYKLSDYTEELASENTIQKYDDRFSIEFLEKLIEEVLNEE